MDFFTADTHFRHNNIRIYCPKRPGVDIKQHDKILTENWNKRVTKDDHVRVCGDFAFTSIEDIKTILSRLNGHKHLIIGNHDKYKWSEYVEAGFETVQRYQFINVKGFGCVGLAHDPSCCIVDSTIPWFVGHLHQQFIRFGNAINVGVDVRSYAPVSIDELMEDLRITLMHMKVDPYAKKEILGEE